MPYKYHDAHHHRFEKARYRVTNWPDYDRGLVQRGDVRFWIEESALESLCEKLRIGWLWIIFAVLIYWSSEWRAAVIQPI